MSKKARIDQAIRANFPGTHLADIRAGLRSCGSDPQKIRDYRCDCAWGMWLERKEAVAIVAEETPTRRKRPKRR